MPEYDYHPKDRAYLKKHGIKWLCYYSDLIAACHKIGAHCFVDGLIQSYDRTKSARQTAIELGITQQCVGRHLRRLGVEINPRGGKNHTGAEKVDGKVCLRCGTKKKYPNTMRCVECMRIYNSKKNR